MENKQNENQIDPKVETKYIKYTKAIATGFAAVGVGSIIGGGTLLMGTTSLLSGPGIAAMSSFFFGGFLINNSFQMWGKMKEKEFKLQRQAIHESSKQKSHNMTHNLSKMVVKTDSKQDCLLTRAFARPAKTPEREVKAKELSKTLRARDASGKKISIKNYQRQVDDR